MSSVLIALLVLGLVCALVLPRVTGFRSQNPSHYATLGPKFDPRIHLAGPILCEGVIYGPLGRVTSRFVADMHGTWAGDKCRLAEAFVYDSGVHQNRAWDLTLQADGSLRAEAEDLVGTGIGHVAGNAVQMRVVDFKKLIQSNEYVLVDIGAIWCPPCRKMQPIVDQIKKEHGNKIYFLAVDGGVDMDVMKHVQFESLPTYIIYQNGKEIWRKSGIVAADEFQKVFAAK